jgi:hypothetical protein
LCANGNRFCATLLRRWVIALGVAVVVYAFQGIGSEAFHRFIYDLITQKNFKNRTVMRIVLVQTDGKTFNFLSCMADM